MSKVTFGCQDFLLLGMRTLKDREGKELMRPKYMEHVTLLDYKNKLIGYFVRIYVQITSSTVLLVRWDDQK